MRKSFVTRSTYQKLKEENKRLMKDITLLVQEGFPSAEKVLTLDKWRKKFKEEREFNEKIREFLGLKMKDFVSTNVKDYINERTGS